MNKEIGIGILDLYDQDSLSKCLDSINLLDFEMVISSLTKNKSYLDNHRTYTSQTPLATLRNNIVSQFRLKKIKYFFILHSNQIIINKNIWNDTIKIAETFGTWFLTNFDTKILSIEDDSGLELNISSKLNSDFLFFNSGIIKNNGYFDERYINGKELDVIDYIINLRKKNLTLPNGFYPTISEKWLEKNNSKIEAIDFNDFPNNNKTVQMSYGYFMHNHKYIPNQNEPQAASNEILLTVAETLQKNYARK